MTNISKTIIAALIAVMAVGSGIATAQTAPTSGEARIHNAHFFGGGHGHHGKRGGHSGMMLQIMSQIDADGSRSITQDEVDAFRTAKVRDADTSGDGNLTLEEFETLFAEMVRNRMIDAFQHLDDDGDGLVTGAEMDDRFGGIVARMDRNGDGELSRKDRHHHDDDH